MGGMFWRKKPAQVAPVEVKPVNTLSAELNEYLFHWNMAKVLPQWKGIADYGCIRIKRNIGLYTRIADRCGNIPPYVVGLIHMMEASFSMDSHLHNGDPLSARTIRVPAGRPLQGEPPFTWEESAIDALHTDHVLKTTQWGIPNTLYFLERYNGTGYLKRGVMSPYLWSGTTPYTKGKFGEDHEYDKDLVSKQVGCAAVMKELQLSGYPLE